MSGIKSRLSGMFGFRSSAAPESPARPKEPEHEEEDEEEDEPVEDPAPAEEEEEEDEEEAPIPARKLVKRKRAVQPPSAPPVAPPPPPPPAKAPRQSTVCPDKVVMVGSLPNTEEWAAAKTYRLCELPARGTEEKTRLRSGDNIFVKPGEQEVTTASPVKGKGKGKAKLVKVSQKEVWLAKIEEIRAVDKSHVFLQIRWYYTGRQLKASGYKYAKALDLHQGELVLTNHKEVVAVGSAEDKADVFEYYETNLDQAQIAEDDYFVRHHELVFDGKGPKGPPEPYCPPSCYCEKPYAISQVMHYCPRSTCERWYHAACLDSQDREISDTLEYITSLPGSDAEPVVTPPARKKGRPAKNAPKPSAVEPSTSIYTPSLLSTAPLALLSRASEPIVRGGDEFGIVGNAEHVLRAREMLKAFCDDNDEDGELGEKWRTEVGLEELEEDVEEELVGSRGVGAAVGSKGRKTHAEEWRVEEVRVCKGCEGKV